MSQKNYLKVVHMKLKTIKLSEENLCNLGFLGKDFLAMTLKAQSLKEKI